MEDMLGKAMTMGGAGLGLAQKLMASIRDDKPVKPAPTLKAPVLLAPKNGKVDPALL
jgi:hypothetical protein